MFRALRGLSRLPLRQVTGSQRSNTISSHFMRYSTKSDVTVTYHLASGEKFTVQGKEGENLLDIAINNDVDIDGFGACEGTLACSTCHLIFTQQDFDKIKDIATDEELDMLDLAYGLTDTSRLGCQVCMTKEMSGLTVQVPEGVNDQR